MVVLTFTDEFTSNVKPRRLFKALILDAPNLIPKLMPEAIKNVQLVEGNGGPGSIQEITIAERDNIKHLKHRIDAIDLEKLTYNYAVIEGDAALEEVDSISHEIKFEATEEGGCKTKNVSKYHPKEGVDVKGEDFKAAREEGLALLKVVDAYLVANPEAYAEGNINSVHFKLNMEVLTFTDEFTSTVQPGRLFKALVLDAPNLIPKLMPEAIKNIQLVEGNGGPGSIQEITIVEGNKIKHLKHRIDAIDQEKLTYSYAVIEGDAALEKVDSIAHEIKFEATKEGGCKIKNVSKYHPKAGVDVKVEDFKAAREEGLALLKVVDAYLVANPEAYA
ncbi:Major allergen Pru ar 1 isoform C [Glycine soja]|uniref:Major allergen Pru ar 1 isoform C n=1 Tax=Glycine soja TaxID=3848 RepID=A0A445GTM2_GLYSO|nr:Major allergen Pru ar 1 isoform C [Glycine soja]